MIGKKKKKTKKKPWIIMWKVSIYYY
jgi:hypothetical protein